MKSGIVACQENAWLGFPDIVYFNGKFIVAYRKSRSHKFHTSGISISIDATLNESGASEIIDVIKPQRHIRWNCPRLSIINNTLFMIVDQIVCKTDQSFSEGENDANNVSVWLLSSKDGMNWTEPKLTNIKGIVPDRLTQSNRGIVTTAHMKSRKKEGFVQKAWIAMYGDYENWHPFLICRDLFYCEGSICYDGERYMCLMRDNSQKGHPAAISYSHDAKRWSNPMLTRLYGCHRPCFGKLNSGKYLVTFREQISTFDKGYWARNTFACLSTKRSVYGKNGRDAFDKTIILPLDHDRSSFPDSGYTGWVQLKNDKIVVVNYITDLARYPYIKWYKFKEEDFGIIS